MDERRIAGKRLTELSRPYLDVGDRDGLGVRLAEEWSPEPLALLLECDDTEVVEVAAVCLGLIGEMAACPSLARALHHDHAPVVEVAENALWSIWFRAGGRMGQAVLSRIARAITAHETENVVPMLTELVLAQPTYAEVFHQRSQAYYLLDSYDKALRDARRTCELNPWHFGALANQANALVGLGRLQEALKTYRAVLQLHPRMHGIRDAIRHLRQLLTPVSS